MPFSLEGLLKILLRLRNRGGVIFVLDSKTAIMNREFNDLNKQTYSHQEGQQSNIAGSGGSSNNAEGSNEQTSGLRREQEADRAQGGQESQTESDRANENEDEGIRGGNSSI